jgi:hypothetical protein
MRVLYIHMTGAFAGGCRSLYEVVRALPAGEVEPLFIAPRGSVHGFLSRLGEAIEARGISQFDNTRYGYYRGLRWLVAIRELAFVPSRLPVCCRGSLPGVYSTPRWWCTSVQSSGTIPGRFGPDGSIGCCVIRPTLSSLSMRPYAQACRRSCRLTSFTMHFLWIPLTSRTRPSQTG